MTIEHLFKERSYVASTVLEVCDVRKLSLWVAGWMNWFLQSGRSSRITSGN